MSDPSRPQSSCMLPVRQLLVSAVMIASVAWLACGGPLWQGAIPARAADPHFSSSKPDDEPATVPGPNRPTERQKKAYSGLAALVGIVIAGLALAALIILWAGRLRRQLRRPLPNADAPGRDFWFLKPPKPTVARSSLPESRQPPHDQGTEPTSGSTDIQ